MMSYEEIVKMLAEGTQRTAEANLDIRSELAQKNAEIEIKETIIMALQDLMDVAQQDKALLEAERDALIAQLDHKRTISNSISDIFAAAKKAMKPTVEVVNNVDHSQQMSSTLNKLRYDWRKGAISDEEFDQAYLEELKQEVDKVSK